MKGLTLLLALITIEVKLISSKDCLPLNSKCTQDCECCGYNDKLRPVKCESRTKFFKGRFCYKSGGINAKCELDSDCKSQNCLEGVCAKPYHRPKRAAPKECEVPVKYIWKVKGTSNFDRSKCISPEYPTNADAELAIDHDLNTVYVNNFPIDGGLKFFPESEGVGSLRSIKICNSGEDPKFNPTCYELNGYCYLTNKYEKIQKGAIKFIEGEQCITITVGGAPFFKKYTLTFPCAQNKCVCEKRESKRDSDVEHPITCPTKLSEVTLYTQCNEIAMSI